MEEKRKMEEESRRKRVRKVHDIIFDYENGWTCSGWGSTCNNGCIYGNATSYDDRSHGYLITNFSDSMQASPMTSNWGTEQEPTWKRPGGNDEKNDENLESEDSKANLYVTISALIAERETEDHGKIREEWMWKRAREIDRRHDENLESEDSAVSLSRLISALRSLEKEKAEAERKEPVCLISYQKPY